MKKRMTAFLCALALILTMIPASAPSAVAVEQQAATEQYKVGYSKVNADPIDVAGTYRNKYGVPVIAGAGGSDPAKPAGYFSVPLAGYGNTSARMSQGKMDENNDGVIDDRDGMFVTCIAVTDPKGNTMLLMALDGISALDALTSKARIEIQNKTGVPRTNITITASHSHSGPDLGSSLNAQSAYNALLCDRFVTAAQQALADQAPATISKGSIEVADMNYVRHYKITSSDGSVQYYAGDNFGGGINKTNSQQVSEPDATMHLLKFTFDSASGKLPIAFVGWRAHPKCNSTGSNAYGLAFRDRSSSDYVGAFRDYLEQNGYRTSFHQGAAGNMNTYSSISSSVNASRATNPKTLITSATRPKVLAGTNKYSSYDGLQAGYLYGQELAKDALAGLNNDANFKQIAVGDIISVEYVYNGEGQSYHPNLVAAAQALKARFESEYPGTAITPSTNRWKNNTGIFPYQYKVGSDYYNLNSYYHYSAVIGRGTTVPDASTQLYVAKIGPELAFVTSANEMYDRYDLSGSIKNEDNDWNTLDNPATYGIPIYMGYTNGAQGYIPNTLAYSYNLNHSTYGVGSYEANTSKFASGSGESILVKYREILDNIDNGVLETNRTKWCNYCEKEVEWSPFAGFLGSTEIPSGHYYMTDDLLADTNFQKQITSKVCLDVNGHSYGNRSGTTGKAFVVQNKGVLNLMNTAQTNGEIQGQGCKTNVSSHTASTRQNNQKGGVIQVRSGGTVNQYAGVTVRRVVKDGQQTAFGGTIYVNAGGTYNLYGGTITGGVTKTVDIIKDDTGSGEMITFDGLGGNVYIEGTFNMNGGTVSDGVASVNGGGIYVAASGKLNISANASVTGNKLASGSANNIYLETASTAGSNFKLSSDFTGTVGVTLPDYQDGLVFGTYAAADPSVGNVALDLEGFSIEYASGKLTVSNACPYCGEKNVQWEEFPLPGAGGVALDIPSGHYYLNDDRTGGGNWNRRIKGDVCLNLNGHTFANESGTTGAAFYVIAGNTFNVFGGGIIQGQGHLTNKENATDNSYRGGVIRVDKGAQANLYNITVQRVVNSTQSSKWGGVIYAGGELNLYGTTVKGGAATINGDGIYVATTGSLTLAGNTTVEKNIYVDTTGDTTGSRLSVEDGYTGTATIELPAYTDGLIFGTAGSYTGRVDLATEKAVCVVEGGNMTIYILDDVCQIVSADGTASAAYDSVADALVDYAYSADAPSYIRLLKDIKTVATIDEEVYLDTNGYDITVTVTESGKLYGMENATNDYAVGTNDLGKVTVQDGSVLNTTDITLGGVRYRYLPLEQDGAFTYHRFDMNTGLGLRPYNENYGVALYYQPYFTTDEVVAGVLNDATQNATFGVSVAINKTGAEELLVNMEDYALTFNQDVCSGKYRVAIPGLIPRNSELTAGTKTLETHDLSSYGVTGRAYIMLITSAGESYFIYDDEDASTSLRNAIQTVDADGVYNKLSKTQKTALNTMYKNYSTAISSWGSDPLTNIGNIKIDISDWFE